MIAQILLDCPASKQSRSTWSLICTGPLLSHLMHGRKQEEHVATGLLVDTSFINCSSGGTLLTVNSAVCLSMLIQLLMLRSFASVALTW
jgi:hypothetical protein